MKFNVELAYDLRQHTGLASISNDLHTHSYQRVRPRGATSNLYPL